MSDDPRKLDPEQARANLRPMWDRIARAERELAAHHERAWYFALLGFDADFSTYQLEGLARIQRVDEPPDPMFLQFAADSPQAALVVSRYSRGITYELVLPQVESLSDEKHLTLAWQIVSAIR